MAELEQYFAALTESYSALVEAIEKAGERGVKVSRQLADDVMAGQREAIALSQRMTADPTNASRNYAALVEAMLAAQGRALALARVTLDESAEGGDVRDAFERIASANRAVMESAGELTKAWAKDNPLAAFWQQGMAAFGQSRTDSNG